MLVLEIGTVMVVSMCSGRRGRPADCGLDMALRIRMVRGKRCVLRIVVWLLRLDCDEDGPDRLEIAWVLPQIFVAAPADADAAVRRLLKFPYREAA